VGLGGFTGVSGLLSFVPAVGLSTLVTALIGIGTGLAVAAKQTFNWEEKSKELWDSFIELDNAKRDLQRYISDVAMYGDDYVDALFIQKLDQKLVKAFSTQVDDLDKYERAADISLEKNFISTLSMAATQAGAKNPVAETLVPEEAAAGIQPMIRGE
jgi:hypothetical protein